MASPVTFFRDDGAGVRLVASDITGVITTGRHEPRDEKRYLHRVEKLHTPVLPLECGRARGVENRDFIREDRHSERCWVTIPTFNSLYPEIAEATDLGATLRSNMRESLPLENWEGTPLEALLRAAGIILGMPAVTRSLSLPGRDEEAACLI